MKYEITITADPNDADYITAVNEISEEDLDTIKPLIQAIKEFKPYNAEYESFGRMSTTMHHHNYPYGECLRGDMGEKSPEELYEFDSKVLELFEEYIPHSEYGIHTIESITICPLQKKTKLL